MAASIELARAMCIQIGNSSLRGNRTPMWTYLWTKTLIWVNKLLKSLHTFALRNLSLTPSRYLSQEALHENLISATCIEEPSLWSLPTACHDNCGLKRRWTGKLRASASCPCSTISCVRIPQDAAPASPIKASSNSFSPWSFTQHLSPNPAHPFSQYTENTASDFKRMLCDQVRKFKLKGATWKSWSLVMFTLKTNRGQHITRVAAYCRLL